MKPVRDLLQGVGALVLAGAMGWPLFYFSSAVLNSTSAVDQGNRGLIVISTSGGDRDYKLNANMEILDNKRLRLTFFFTAKDITYGDKGNTNPIRYSIAFWGPNLDASGSTPTPVTCGPSQDPIPREPYSELTKGTQNALKLDSIGGVASATNFKGPDDPKLSTQLAKRTFSEWSGELWLLSDGASYRSREESWAEACILPEAAVWRTVESTAVASESRTLLPPQVDFTSQGVKTDHQTDMDVTFSMARPSGWTLREAYPEPETSDSRWQYAFMSSWSGSKGSESNVGFTDQPVWMIEERNSTDKKAAAFMVLGIGWALVANLLFAVIKGLWLYVSALIAYRVFGEEGD